MVELDPLTFNAFGHMEVNHFPRCSNTPHQKRSANIQCLSRRYDSLRVVSKPSKVTDPVTLWIQTAPFDRFQSFQMIDELPKAQHLWRDNQGENARQSR